MIYRRINMLDLLKGTYTVPVAVPDNNEIRSSFSMVFNILILQSQRGEQKDDIRFTVSYLSYIFLNAL
jgi:hypothetical protein